MSSSTPTTSMLSSNGQRQDKGERSQRQTPSQSLLLSLPTEILRMILGYVLSTSAYIPAGSSDYLEERIDACENFRMEEIGIVLDSDDEDIVDDADDEPPDRPAGTSTKTDCEDLPIFCADANYEGSVSGKNLRSTRAIIIRSSVVTKLECGIVPTPKFLAPVAS